MDSYTRRAARNFTLGAAGFVAYVGGLMYLAAIHSSWVWVPLAPVFAVAGLLLVMGVTSIIELTAKDYRDRDREREELERTAAPHP